MPVTSILGREVASKREVRLFHVSHGSDMEIYLILLSQKYFIILTSHLLFALKVPDDIIIIELFPLGDSRRQVDINSHLKPESLRGNRDGK